MQDRIGRRDDPFGADRSGSWTKEREQFGGTSPLVFVRLPRGVAFRLPGDSRLRDGLRGPRFILVELDNPGSFRLLVRQLDQSFFSGVCSS